MKVHDVIPPDAQATRLLMRPWFIIAIALLLRLAWAALVPVEPVSDSVLYDAFARSIAAGTGYAYPSGALTVYWPVGTSAVYATIYSIFGPGFGPIVVFQSLLGALIVGLTWRLANDYLGPVAAAWAAWFTAIWPLLIQFTTVLASELLFIALLLAALNVWSTRRLPTFWRAVFWGALIAAATYVRPTAWPLLLIFPLLEWVFRRETRSVVVLVVASTLTAAILFAPWVYRNYQLFDRFVLVAANGGVNLWMGNNPQSTGGYMPLPPTSFADEVERDRYLGRKAVEFIASEPSSYVRLALRRLIGTYDRESIGVVWNEPGLRQRVGSAEVMALKIVSSAFWWSMLLLGGLGAVQVARLRLARKTWPILAALLFFAAVPVLTVAQDRYHVPLNPLLAILAALGALQLLRYKNRPVLPEHHV